MAKTGQNKLTDKQERFCQEYLIDLNAKQAAIRAGYSADTAEVQGSRLLSNAKVQEYISARQHKIANKLEVTAERTLLEYARIAYSDVRNLYDESGRLKPISELDEDTARTISSVETDEIKDEGNYIGDVRKVKLWNKLGALDSLAKHLGLFEIDNKQKTPVGLDISKLNITDLKNLQQIIQKANA